MTKEEGSPITSGREGAHVQTHAPHFLTFDNVGLTAAIAHAGQFSLSCTNVIMNEGRPK